MKKASIKYVSAYLPENVVYNQQIEDKIRFEGKKIDQGFLEKLFGSRTRRIASDDMQVSDLASQAAQSVINANRDTVIDLLIFAAASSDLIEPATANIIQGKLGLTCPVMDIKNACNSFVSAIQVSSAFIEAGMYENILVVCGEKLGEVVNYSPQTSEELRKCISGYSLGDAGAAMLLGKNGSEIVYQKFRSWGEYWQLCTVEGGGSMAYRDYDKYYFQSDSRGLKKIFEDEGPKFVNECLNESGWRRGDIDCVVSHQISSTTTDQIARYSGIPASRFVNTFGKYGNTAAATIPLALNEAIEAGKLTKGDKLMLLGLGAGVSLSVQLVEW
ncbi:3-oxoacyl-ACP synthase III family protein [Dyadobacter sp. CY323]|uniref:3-oxoacyl-ACP synthase III family protein n=1 Tax=Dyadobacter sp. CY323 TaxID=2907302 RepID=UPI001F290CB3|nr:ketoacyl-ACP synthase III [Dyadobacter sp. CY323]MCE6991841.1 ketoacyl-ACP synthase III [Dyadobacter sp. CY323]